MTDGRRLASTEAAALDGFLPFFERLPAFMSVSSPPTQTQIWQLVKHKNKSSSTKSEVKLNSKTNQFLVKCTRCAEVPVLSCEKTGSSSRKNAADITKMTGSARHEATGGVAPGGA
jgi:hypothetical protein